MEYIKMAETATAAAPAAKKADVEKVSMSDGRTIEFAGKRKMLKDLVFGDTPGVRFDFRNGATVFFAIPDVKVEGTDNDMALQLACHGAAQKIGDETASSDPEYTIDDMVLDVEGMCERLTVGKWNATREGTGVGGTSILLQALMELSGKAKDEIKAVLEKLSQKEKVSLRNSTKVKPVIERLEKERDAKVAKVDVSAQLAELGI
jgi:hypothetical protein